MSGQHNQQQRQQLQQHHRLQKQRKQAADRRSQIAARAENGQQLDDDQTDEEEANDQINQVEDIKEAVRGRTETGSLDERAEDRGKSFSGSEQSFTLSEQVITSLQVNSKKAVEPLIKPKQAPAITAATPKNDQKQANSRHDSARHILDPSGSLYYHWSMVVSFAFLYNFWSLSYRFAFREIDFDTVAFWFALDYSADIIYILDVVINSRTGYLEDGVLQRNKDKISVHYRECTLFYLDCFCLLPLDILYLSIGFNSILRCTRLVKIYKFWSYVDRTERHTNYPNVFRTFTLVHYILVIFHWNACLFHMISKNKIIDIEDLYKINDNRCIDVLCQYLHAFYWSTLALTTIGDLPRPRTKGEYVFVIVELFFGLFLFASVLGHVANIVTNVSAARKEFQAKLDAVKTFMRMRRVSDELQSKVIRWFDYLWISQKSSDEERSVACLPDRLKAEIAIHVHLDTLKRVDIFQNTEAGFLCELVLRLKPVLFSPGDYVCRKNEVGHEMYIVSRGILEVVTDEGKTVVATLKAGSYFGEISVLNVGLAGNKRTASVRSVGYSDLFCLNKQDLWDVLKNYPNAEARIRARAEERLNKLDINQSRTSDIQTSAKIGLSKSSKLNKGNCDVGTTSTTATSAINGSARLSNQRRQRANARCNLINRHNKKQCNLWRQIYQNSSHYNDLFDHYKYDEDTNHRKCCLSNQTSLKYQPVCDSTIMSMVDTNQELDNKASGSRTSSGESLSDILIDFPIEDRNKQFNQAEDNSLQAESDELGNGKERSKIIADSVKNVEDRNKKAIQRRQNYPTPNSERYNRNIPAKLLSGSISSGLEARDVRQHNGFKLCRPDQGYEQVTGKRCQYRQYCVDDNLSIASNRPIDLRRCLNRRTGKLNHSARQCHHSYCYDEREDLEQASEKATLYSKKQPIVASSSAIIPEQRPPSLWLPNQLSIYAASGIDTAPEQYHHEGAPRTIGPIIQVPMLATPTQDGHFQYLQPISIGNSANPQSVSMTHLNVGSNLNLHGQVTPRSANQLEGQFLFVSQMNLEDQLSKSSPSFQAAQARQQDSQQTRPHRVDGGEDVEEELNPRQTTAMTNIDGSLESDVTTGGVGGGNSRSQAGYYLPPNQPTSNLDNNEQQSRIGLSEPANNGAKLSESGNSSNELSEIPFENLNKNLPR